MRRVVITGLGAITPLGGDAQRSWSAVCEGRSGIRRITRFDPTPFRTQIAGEVQEFRPEEFLDRREIRRMDLFVQYAVVAARMAVEDAALSLQEEEPQRVGVIVGTGFGGLITLERNHIALLNQGPQRVSPLFLPMMIANMASAQVSIHLGAKGPNSCVVTACATGAHCIGDAFRVIQRGDAEVMIAGGTEATLTPLMVAGFDAMRAMSTRNDEPERASRPFDRERDGFVPAEGAGVMVLEELEHARRRGARIYAELIGYGLTGDAYHVTAPDPEGDGAARCMAMALRDAGISPAEVDYINAHGTSTPLNDVVETMAIKRVFGEHAYRVPVSSTKSMTGHLLGAAGSVEAIFTVLAIRDGIIPPTINLEEPDPQCDLDYVPQRARRQEVRVAMSNSFGFGGANAVLVFRKLEE